MAITQLLGPLLVGIVLVFGLGYLLAPKKAKLPLPPGPKPLPLVGNVADMPPAGAREWEHWAKFKDLYGPISSVSVMGTTFIILNDLKLALELMESRSATYSSRPTLVFGGEMCGWDKVLGGQYYGNRFRAFRKAIHTVMGSKTAVLRFSPIQDIEVRRFLFRTLEKPDQLSQHIRTEAGAIILNIAYGYTIEPHKRDPLVDIADEALEQFSAAFTPGAWMVDLFPVLRYVPDWVPGASFKKTARAWKATLMETAGKPYQFVKQQMAEKLNHPSYVSNLLDKYDGKATAEDEYVIKWTAASLYTGGADTSVSSMATFFLAMSMFPEFQKKAQEEIDRVIGTDRLPDFDDRSKLPYVEAVLKETFRWHPIGPMGLPHVTTQDDTCSGYHIPKGALILANIWYIAHDPSIYDDPAAFNPQRFLGPSPALDPQTYVFGFGRRICAGMHLADSSVWLTIVRSLAVFNISKGIDGHGNAIEPIVEFSPGIISHPRPFKATIKPRSAKHEALIRAVESDYPWENSDAEYLKNIRI